MKIASLFAAAIMGVAVWAGEKGWKRIGPVDWPALAAFVAGGALLYFALLLLISPSHRGQLRWWFKQWKARHA